MKISELSKRSGVSQRMLRYFEQQGLLKPQRTVSDYRNYDADDLKCILEMREWQLLGLTIREILELKNFPDSVESILGNVFVRERELFLEKRNALRDLRERLTGKKYPYFEERVAYSIPDAEKVVAELNLKGWENISFTYILFGEWQAETKIECSFVGEIIWQSSYYLIVSENAAQESTVEKFMADFCCASNNQWPEFDGHPPKSIDPEDIGDFFSSNEIVACLSFNAIDAVKLIIVLPYQALFALAKKRSV